MAGVAKRVDDVVIGAGRHPLQLFQDTIEKWHIGFGIPPWKPHRLRWRQPGVAGGDETRVTSLPTRASVAESADIKVPDAGGVFCPAGLLDCRRHVQLCI